jgi:hypothetical protein
MRVPSVCAFNFKIAAQPFLPLLNSLIKAHPGPVVVIASLNLSKTCLLSITNFGPDKIVWATKKASILL